MIKRLLISMSLSLVVLTIQAQRIGCVHSEERSATRSDSYALPMPIDFDPQKTYRQPVVLITFSDQDFSMDNPKDYYNSLFNEKGFNKGYGLGCVADYFRDQSGGRLNMQFDIYGPFKVNKSAGGHGSSYYGEDAMRSALQQLYETETTDFSVYNWDTDTLVNQVIFVTAGYSGHQTAGYIWPNTGRLRAKLPGGIYLHFGSISCELWEDGTLCGIGVIAHEFCHCIGLPDVYPMSPASIYSAVDEWDLMDGGNYINKGWCPANLSAMEKMYLGWGKPEELTEPTTVTDMKPIGNGGKTYIIRNSGYADEYYLLENRQQVGWDYGCPGNGLLISHVDFSQSAWGDNCVNISNSHFRYDLFHADGKSYLDWDPKNNGKDMTRYTMADNMRSSYLSTSAYPYTNPETQLLNDLLTDTSSPASVLFNDNAEGVKLMGKSITNIRMHSDGTISFDFMKNSTGINAVVDTQKNDDHWYDLQGRRLYHEPTRKGLYIHNGKLVPKN